MVTSTLCRGISNGENIGTGTEQNDWDLASSEQLEVDAANTTVTLGADRLVKIEVQLGNAANLLHADGGILAITVKVTPADTGDKCIISQVQMNLVAGDQLALISIPEFWAKSGSVLEVHAKSSNAGDSSVGGKVWIYDVAPADISGVAVPGDEMTLENDAITSAKYDESTAYPVTEAMKEAGSVIVQGTVDDTVSPSTTEFEAADITEATPDHFNGRVVIFVTGDLQYQATDITDYAINGGKGHFTVTALTEAPSDTDTFVIV